MRVKFYQYVLICSVYILDGLAIQVLFIIGLVDDLIDFRSNSLKHIWASKRRCFFGVGSCRTGRNDLFGRVGVKGLRGIWVIHNNYIVNDLEKIEFIWEKGNKINFSIISMIVLHLAHQSTESNSMSIREFILSNRYMLLSIITFNALFMYQLSFLKLSI